MSNFKFSQLSITRLIVVHTDLVLVMGLAITRTPLDLTVLEGPRTIETQEKYVASGASMTMDSNHLLTEHKTAAGEILLCRAVDIAPYVNGSVSWAWPHYDVIVPVIKQAAADLGVVIKWGGDWSNFKDGNHWELPR